MTAEQERAARQMMRTTGMSRADAVALTRTGERVTVSQAERDNALPMHESDYVTTTDANGQTTRRRLTRYERVFGR